VHDIAQRSAPASPWLRLTNDHPVVLLAPQAPSSPVPRKCSTCLHIDAACVTPTRSLNRYQICGATLDFSLPIVSHAGCDPALHPGRRIILRFGRPTCRCPAQGKHHLSCQHATNYFLTPNRRCRYRRGPVRSVLLRPTEAEVRPVLEGSTGPAGIVLGAEYGGPKPNSKPRPTAAYAYTYRGCRSEPGLSPFAAGACGCVWYRTSCASFPSFFCSRAPLVFLCGRGRPAWATSSRAQGASPSAVLLPVRELLAPPDDVL